jgi:hypothetical protein
MVIGSGHSSHVAGAVPRIAPDAFAEGERLLQRSAAHASRQFADDLTSA